MAVTHWRLYFGCVDAALIRESDAPALTCGSVRTRCRLVEVVVSLWLTEKPFVGASCIRRPCSSLAQACNSSDATRASIAVRRDAITSAPWAAGTAETR